MTLESLAVTIAEELEELFTDLGLPVKLKIQLRKAERIRQIKFWLLAILQIPRHVSLARLEVALQRCVFFHRQLEQVLLQLGSAQTPRL